MEKCGVRIGLMGFDQVGRQIYRLALADPRFDVVALLDIGQPAILHRLLLQSLPHGAAVALQGNYLVHSPAGGASSRSRLMAAEKPAEIPWDLLGVDVVIDATNRFRTRAELAAHLDNGAKRVLLSSLPEDEVDRVALYGINQDSAEAADRIVSAGSPSTTAAALALRVVSAAKAVSYATMTSVHAYTSDQSLQDHAGPDYRRSRSGAENIIPNATPAPQWIERVLPTMRGRIGGFALNVPVQTGSLLDLTVALRDSGSDAAAINALFVAAAAAEPELIAVTEDPIVSSDVKGCAQSILVDLKGTMQAGARMIKLLAWHETLGHARSILDLAALYATLDADLDAAAPA